MWGTLLSRGDSRVRSCEEDGHCGLEEGEGEAEEGRWADLRKKKEEKKIIHEGGRNQ